jgi:hypothetical protein
VAVLINCWPVTWLQSVLSNVSRHIAALALKLQLWQHSVWCFGSSTGFEAAWDQGRCLLVMTVHADACFAVQSLTSAAWITATFWQRCQGVYIGTVNCSSPSAAVCSAVLGTGNALCLQDHRHRKQA